MELDQIIHGNTLSVLNTFPSESIDCVITSPPYWGLRSYSTNRQVWGNSECEHEWGNKTDINHLGRRDKNRGDFGSGHIRFNGKATDNMIGEVSAEHTTCQLCNAWRGELGLEPTFQLYIEHLQTIFDEVYRVLKKTGTCWVNIGDTYSSGNRGDYHIKHENIDHTHVNPSKTPPNRSNCGIADKSLCNIPHRFAISMTDSGWIQRNTIIWHKPSCMPSSAKDRFTVDFEYVFLFSKSKKYYFEQQFEGYEGKPQNRYAENNIPHKYTDESVKTSAMAGGLNEICNNPNPNGRNKRTVWRVDDNAVKGVKKLNEHKPYTVQEREGYVAYRELPDIQVLGNYLNDARKRAGYTIDQVEAELDSQAPHHWFNGETYPTVDDWPRIKPLLNLDGTYDAAITKEYLKPAEKMNYPIGRNMRTTWRINPQPFKDAHFAVFPEKLVEPMIKAGCPSEGVVLDPFIGSGTTALVARKLQRHYIGIDLNADYVTMANKRLSEVL